MSLAHGFVPVKPFPEFKWKWACLQCTEGLNDPVVLLGVLFRMRKLELRGEEIKKLVSLSASGGYEDWLKRIKSAAVASEIERKRVGALRRRPFQSRFRHDVLGKTPRCIITNVTMPEVLEAAHIIPFKYHGEDTRANGFAMRMDIHQLFDSGHLRIHPNGSVFLTDRARMDYGASIPPLIRIPDWINLDFVRWRWENYNGI